MFCLMIISAFIITAISFSLFTGSTDNDNNNIDRYIAEAELKDQVTGEK